MLETKRLNLREFVLSDAEFAFELMNSPLYIKYIGDRGIKCFDDAKMFLKNKVINSYKVNGYGLYAVTLKKSDQVIGMAGLVCRENLPSPDIGFAFLPKFMGNGYAFEASQRVMSYAYKSIGLDQILAIVREDNTRSLKLLDKLGLKYHDLINWEGEKILLLSTHPL